MAAAQLGILLLIFNLATRLSSAPSQKCMYSFTVDSGEAVAMCGLSDSSGHRSYGDIHNTATVDGSTAVKLLSAVTQLLEHQNIVSEVKVASQSIQELKAELISQQKYQAELVDSIVALQSNIQLIASSQNAAQHGDTPFRGFSGKANRYLGCPVNHPDRIHEIAPIRKKFDHVLKIIPRSCLEWRQRGYHQKGVYIIDPDGFEGEAPFEVECIMTADEPAMLIKHDHMERARVVGFESPGSFKVNISYTTVSSKQMSSLIGTSYRCEQFLRWECKGASLSRESWWEDRHGNKVTYWGGGGPGRGCACHRNSSCYGNNLCNCDANDDSRWLEDSGNLDDKNYLPVTRLLFGDTGSYSEEGYYTLGPLACYSNETNPYASSTAFLPVEVWRPFNVFCDYDGWVLIQRNSEDANGTFDYFWEDYVQGFGDFDENFWLGLEKIHQLTGQNVTYTLRIDLKTRHGVHYYAQYSEFRLGDLEEKYRIYFGEFGGTADDILGPYKGMPFSTADEDNDRDAVRNCAKEGYGGFWYNTCNDVYVNSKTISWGKISDIVTVEMRIRPTQEI